MSAEPIQLFAGFTLDRSRGCLRRNGEDVHLRPLTYEVLRYLAENRGRLVGKEELIRELWGGRAVTDGALGKCIEEIREALGEEARQVVRNVRGRGYLFEAPAGTTASPSAAPPPNAPVAAPTEGAVVPPRRGRLSPAVRTFLILAICAAVAATLGALRRTPPHPREIRSVAILPFAPGGDAIGPDALSDGWTEGLTDRVVRQGAVKVTARASAFQLRGAIADPRVAGKRLGVDGLVLGRIAASEDALKVRVEVVDARDGTQIWGHEYESLRTRIQALQEEVAVDIVRALVPAGASTNPPRAPRAAADPLAYQAYLDGLYDRRSSATGGLLKARQNFERAVTLDPSFAVGWAALATANHMLAGHSLADPKESVARARSAALKALELDASLIEAQLTLAIILVTDWDFQGAERGYRRALELDPSSAEVHRWYATLLSSLRRPEEALAEIRRAQALEPLRLSLEVSEGSILTQAGRHEEAIAKIRAAQTKDPNLGQFALGLAYSASGRFEEAVEAYRKVVLSRGESSNVLCYLGHALARSGRRDEAMAILERLASTTQYVSPTELAVLQVGLGNHEQALDTLERAFAEHDPQLSTLSVESHFDGLRAEPRFAALERRVGLPP